MNAKQVVLKLLTRRRSRRSEFLPGSFDSSSIGDLAFLLLIYFIVTASFMLRQGIFFSLPSQKAGSISIEQKKIVEVYPVNNGFLYQGETLNRSEFKEILSGIRRDIPGSVLAIHMKPRIPYDRLVDTLSVAKETGFARISLKNLGRDR